MKTRNVTIVLAALLIMCGCVAPSTTLQDSSGNVVNCRSVGGGIIGSAAALSMQSNCVERMQKSGYKVVDKNTVAPKPSAEAASVGLTLPAGWENRPLTENMAKSGGSVYAANAGAETYVQLSVASREGVSDMMAYVKSRRAAMEGALLNPQSTEITQVVLSGRPAYRFEVAGNIKGGIKITNLFTVIEGTRQIAILRAWSKTADYGKHKGTFESISSNVNGLI